MEVLNREQIISAIKSVRGGTITRIAYKTEVPLKSEAKKEGYTLTKIVETSVRCGVAYSSIASVIERRLSENYSPTSRRNNYEWVIRNRIKHNKHTDKDYIVVAILPEGHHTRTKYILSGTFVGTIDMGDTIIDSYKDLVVDSYFKRAEQPHEIKTIAFENVLMLNNVGSRINF